MLHRRHPVFTLLLASLLAGCMVPTGGRTGVPAKPITRPKPTASQALAPVTGAGNLVSNGGGNIISDNGASLIGKVKAPAGLLSNNGGNIISDNGASYRLLTQATEAPVAGGIVQLLDAEGKAVAGADGQPLQAVTDAQGRYAFKGIQPANNLVLVVDLGKQGALKAIAPKQSGDGRTIDLDLISTLSTSYILDQYVESQPDRQRTLDKLPADVEADTRLKVGAAFAKGTAAVPEALTDEAVVATVNALREQDPAIHQQLETVKSLLVVAGLSDLGSGRDAKELNLGTIGDLWFGADGLLHLSAPYHRRIWKIDAQGRIQNAAGSGVGGSASLTGKPGPESPLARLRGTKPDATGRVWVSEYELSGDVPGAPAGGRISRLERDGRMTELSREFSGNAIAMPASGDDALVLDFKSVAVPKTVSPTGRMAEYSLYTLSPGRARQLVGTYSTDDAKRLARMTEIAPAPGGGMLAVLTSTEARTLCRLSATAATITDVYTLPKTVTSAALDMAGNLLMVSTQPTKKLEVRKADGTVVTLAEKLPTIYAMRAGELAPDGSAWVVLGGQAYHVQAGQFTHVAGSSASGLGVKASDYFLENPTGLAAGPGGLFVSDEDRGDLVRIGPDQIVNLFAGTGEIGDYEFEGTPDGDGGPALEAQLVFPTLLHTDAAGNVFIRESKRIRKVAANGTISSPFKLSHEDGREIIDFAVVPDGTLYLAVQDDQAEIDMHLMRLAPTAAQPETLQSFDLLGIPMVLAVSADGTLYYATVDEELTGMLVRWTPAGPQTLTTDDRFDPTILEPGNMAVDAAGRLYVIDHAGLGTVQRFDPATGQWAVVAGANGRHFNGMTIDTSLEFPRFPRFDPKGDLYFIDAGHAQVKRIAAGEL